MRSARSSTAVLIAAACFAGCSSEIRVRGPAPEGARSVVIAINDDSGARVFANKLPLSGELLYREAGADALLIYYRAALDTLRLDPGAVPLEASGVALDQLSSEPKIFAFQLGAGPDFAIQETLPNWAVDVRVARPDLSAACPNISARGIVGPVNHEWRGGARLDDGTMILLSLFNGLSTFYRIPPGPGFPEPTPIATLPGIHHDMEVIDGVIVTYGSQVLAPGTRAGMVTLFDTQAFVESSTLTVLRQDTFARSTEGECRCKLVALKSDDGGVERLRGATNTGDIYARNVDGTWQHVFDSRALPTENRCGQRTPSGEARFGSWNADDEALNVGLNFGPSNAEEARVVRSSPAETFMDCLDADFLITSSDDILQITGRMTGRDGQGRFLASRAGERFILERDQTREPPRWRSGHLFAQFKTIERVVPIEVQVGNEPLPGYLWVGHKGIVGVDFEEGTRCPGIAVSGEDARFAVPFGDDRFLLGLRSKGAAWVEVK